MLRGRGIIETAQGRDSRVARLNRVQDASPLIHLFSTQPRTLYDLLDVRALLEANRQGWRQRWEPRLILL